MRSLRIDEQSAIQVVIEQVTQPLDLISFSRATRAVIQVLDREGVRQERLQLHEQRDDARIVQKMRATGIRRRVDPVLE